MTHFSDNDRVRTKCTGNKVRKGVHSDLRHCRNSILRAHRQQHFRRHQRPALPTQRKNEGIRTRWTTYETYFLLSIKKAKSRAKKDQKLSFRDNYFFSSMLSILDVFHREIQSSWNEIIVSSEWRLMIIVENRLIFYSVLVAVYILGGTFCLIIVPSLVFTFMEEWSLLDAVYFSLISLTTVGFGDFVPRNSPPNHFG